jgi:pimeloyl-ACP methyl ester carboxylesterase
MTIVVAGGLRTHVQRLRPDSPDGEPPVVVFVHGILTDSLASYYFTLGPAFAAAGVDAIMYDLRGHGRTDRPESGYQVERFVADLDALLDELGETRPVHLIGNSFGGTVAFGYAAARPDRVASVAMIEAEPATEMWSTRIAEVLGNATRELAREEVIEWIGTEYNLHTARLSRTAGKLLHSTTIGEDIPASQVLDEDQIAAVGCPVLAIYGSESPLSQLGPWLEYLLPHCRTAIVDGQQHSVLIEATARTLDLTLNWVREHTRPRCVSSVLLLASGEQRG